MCSYVDRETHVCMTSYLHVRTGKRLSGCHLGGIKSIHVAQAKPAVAKESNRIAIYTTEIATYCQESPSTRAPLKLPPTRPRTTVY